MAKEDDAVPRFAGRALRAAAALMRSPVGAPLARKLGALVIDRKLAGVDFAAEGEPPPLYMPPPWRRPAGRKGR
jgi:hypothetical protein